MVRTSNQDTSNIRIEDKKYLPKNLGENTSRQQNTFEITITPYPAYLY